MQAARQVQQGAAPAGRPEKALSVCFVAPHAWPAFSRDPRIQEVGGAEVQMAVLARLFAARGWQVSMISLDYGQPDRARLDGVTVHKAYRQDAGIPVLRFAHPRLTSMWRALGAASAGIYYCRAASLWPGVVAEYARRHGARLVYAGASDRDFVPGQAGQMRYARDRWLFERGLARADAIVAQNELQRSQCLANYGRDATVIPSCYVPPAGAGNGRGEEVLWVATLHANKRPEMLLELAARLPHRRFTMVGGPSLDGHAVYDAVRARAGGLPNLEFCGFLPLPEVERRFERARVLVNTSAYEGMPNTFLQAWARGVPTVATVDVGVAVNRVAADVEGLAAGVEALFDDAAWRMASRAVRTHFERVHSSEEVFARYARLFAELGA